MKKAILVILFWLSSSAQAAVVYSQTPPNQTGQFSDIDTSLGISEADNFSLASDETVLSITWRGIYSSSVPTDGNPPNSPLETDSFTISFYTEAEDGLPGTLAQSFTIGDPATRVDTGLDTAMSDIYEYTADLSGGISLTAGVDYWVSIVADTTADLNDDWAWVGCISCEGGVIPPLGSSATLNPFFSADWSPNRAEYYFVLSNASIVPIPAAAWLFGSALAGLGWLKRRSTLKSA